MPRNDEAPGGRTGGFVTGGGTRVQATASGVGYVPGTPYLRYD